MKKNPYAIAREADRIKRRYEEILAQENSNPDTPRTGRDKAEAAAKLALEEAEDYATKEAVNFVKDEINFDDWGTKKGLLKRSFESFVTKPSRRYTQRFVGFIVFVIVSFVLVSYLQGPVQIVHFAEYIQETHYTFNNYIFNNRLATAVFYAGTANRKELRNLSLIGNVLAESVEIDLKRNGITPEYDGTNRVKALTIDPNAPKGQEALRKLQEKGIKTSELVPGDDGKIRIEIDRTDMGTTSSRFRRKVMGSMVATLDMDGVSGAMASRVMKLRAGVDFHPLKRTVRRADEKLNAYIQRVLENVSSNIRDGTGTPDYTAAAEDATEENGEKGRSESSKNIAPEAEAQLATATGDEPTPVKAEKLRNTLRTKLTSGFGITAFVGIVCAIQKIGDAAVQMTYDNVNTPMVRTAGFIMSGASQVKTGIDANNEEVGIINNLLYDNTTNTSWVDAASIQRNMGENPTGPELPESARPTTGSRTDFFASIDNFISAVPGGEGVCSAITSTVGGYLFSAMGIALTSTGPLSAVLNVLGEIAQNMIISSFMDDLVDWLSNDMVDPLKGGANIGSLADYGGILSANDAIIAAGGTELSPAERVALTQETNSDKQYENKNKSLYARYLDLHDYDSLASTALMKYSYPFRASSVKSVASAPFRILGSTLANFGGILTQKVFADESDGDEHDYGFERFGFTVGEIDNVDFMNPYENEDILLANNDLSELNSTYGIPCFGVSIDPATGIITTEKKMMLYDNIPQECKDKNNETLTRYRFLLVDTYANLAYACYKDVDISPRDPCAELHIGNADETTNTDAGTFRVATFNVLGDRHTTGDDGWASGATRMEEAFKELGANGIQVAGLQEFEKEQRAKFIELAGTNWGLFPDTEKYKNLASYNSIIWKTTEFELVESGYRTNLEYFDGRDLDAPWVKLKHKTSGQIVYITNTHDPDNTTEAPNQQKYRVANAKKHKADLLERITAGEKTLLLGDFNSNATLGVKDEGLKRDELTYCILTEGEKIHNAYDSSDGKSGHCPTKKNFSIDHIYHSTNLTVSNWTKIDTLERRKITDHPLVFADVALGSDSAEGGSNTSKDGWQWPIVGYTKADVDGSLGWGERGSKGVHKAIDMGAPVGTKVVAAHDGVVKQSYFDNSCGWMYSIKATGTPYWITYQHLQKSAETVMKGTSVTAGQVIGEVGKYGGTTCGSYIHLHFGIETRDQISFYATTPNTTINPLRVLP